MGTMRGRAPTSAKERLCCIARWRRSMVGLDFETAARTSAPIAAFPNGRAEDFLQETFDDETGGGMFIGDGGDRARDTPNDKTAVLSDHVCDRAQLGRHELVRHVHTRLEAHRRPFRA